MMLILHTVGQAGWLQHEAEVEVYLPKLPSERGTISHFDP